MPAPVWAPSTPAGSPDAATASCWSPGTPPTAVCPGYTHTAFHERLGLAKGEEGIPNWLWLQAPRVVTESLRDVGRGKAVSVPSRRYRAIYAVAQVAPSGLVAKLAERGR